jgi:PAS domain S-box-containing protein
MLESFETISDSANASPPANLGTEFLARRVSSMGGEIDQLRRELADRDDHLQRLTDQLNQSPVGWIHVKATGEVEWSNRTFLSWAESVPEIADPLPQEGANTEDAYTIDSLRENETFEFKRRSTDSNGTATYSVERRKKWSDAAPTPTGGSRRSERIETLLKLTGSCLWEAKVPVGDWLSENGSFAFKGDLPVELGFNKTTQPGNLNSLIERVHPADRAATCSAFHQLFDGPDELECRCRLQSRDGRYHWLAFRANRGIYDHGNIRVTGVVQSAVVSSFRTAGRTNVAETFAKSGDSKVESAAVGENRKADLFENAPDMILSVCAESGKILDCNATACDKTGFSKTELVGRPVIEMYSPACWTRAREASNNFLHTGHVENIHLSVRRKGGGVLEVSVNVSAIRGHDGKIIASRAVWRDVTKVRNSEREQRQKEHELAHVMRVATLGELATGMAHELNQPLASISAFASGVLVRIDKSRTEPDQAIKDAVKQIRDEADRAAAIIRRLRAFVRKGESKIEDITLQNLVANISILLDANDVPVELHLGCSSKLVRCDSIQIHQVLMNLVKNASDALFADPPTTPVIEIQAVERSGWMEIHVCDNANREFTADQAEKIFDSFYTTKTDGVGLGLPLSRSFIEAMGGQLWAEPNSSCGAKFIFTIPLAE